jgi:hypothetical protein
MTIDEVIDRFWERSNHGTRREDIEAAYDAGEEAVIKRLTVEAGEPLGHRYRSSEDGAWKEWHLVDYEPQGPADASFQIEPLYTVTQLAAAVLRERNECTKFALEELRKAILMYGTTTNAMKVYTETIEARRRPL